VATCYDPLLDNEPELACTMAASVKQRIAFGERAGQKVRRIGSGFGYEGERPELTGPRLHLLSAVVRRHDRHQVVAVGTLGEAGSDRALAACPPRPLCRLFGTA